MPPLSLQVRGTKPYHELLSYIAYTLQKPFKDRQQIIQPLAVDKKAEWYSTSVLVPMHPQAQVKLCLVKVEPAKLNQT